MGLFTYLKSTILSKVVMAVTGIILVLFITGHAIGNLQVFIGKEQFNAYAHFLQSLGEILWLIRIGLFLALVFHVITSLRLKLLNMSARPTKYHVKHFVKAKLTSRTMLWTGSMIFAFLVYHILHFTVGITNPAHYAQFEQYSLSGAMTQILMERHDAFKMVILGFRVPFISITYIIGVVLMGFHLSHAIQSCIQTLGYSSPEIMNTTAKISNAFSILIVLCFISIPVTILLGLVGGSI
jgi:succinate dehydrogenase / fumarate reductase, cytochrome b subunit